MAVSVISTLSTDPACDAFVSISKNAIFIIAEAGESDNADLDGPSSAVAATGRGFAMGSSIISFAPFCLRGDCRNCRFEYKPHLLFIGGLLVGATLPYMFAALVFLSSQMSAGVILVEAHKQLDSDSITTDRNVNAATVDTPI